ncbi:putative PLAC8 motif-containing protein [Helianthus annuus]|nr:putative PLAC8 motif-containing protein [Helianthus annuus]
MNSSLPNENKEKAPQHTNGPQIVPAAAPSSGSNSSKGAAGPSSQYVVGVPPQQAVAPTWSTGLFECFDDIPTLIITAFAPCVTFGQIAEMVDRGQNSKLMLRFIRFASCWDTILHGVWVLLSAYYRIKMSHLYKLPDDPIINILVHLICEPCALCQEYRELQARGFNMQLGVGWRNQSPEIQQSGGHTVPPKVPEGMTR